MSTLTTTERGDLAEAMLPVAASLAGIVHGDGGPEDVHALVGRFDTLELTALAVVLAGLVDPAQRIADALDYLDWDEHGRPTDPPTGPGTIRSLVPNRISRIGDPRTTALRLHKRGMAAPGIAKHVGVTERTIHRWVATWSQKAEATA